MLEAERLKEDEYEKQYYGFSSTELYTDFKDQISQAVKLALGEIEIALNEATSYDEVLRSQKIVEFHKMYMDSAKVSLQKFENEARKIFAIPKNVVLDEDQEKVKNVSDDDIIELKREVAELEKELLREQVFLAKCKQQKELIDTTFKITYERINSAIKSLNNLPNIELTGKEKRIMDLQEEHGQYYFSNDNNETEKLHSLEIEVDFSGNDDDFFKP